MRSYIVQVAKPECRLVSSYLYRVVSLSTQSRDALDFHNWSFKRQRGWYIRDRIGNMSNLYSTANCGIYAAGLTSPPTSSYKLRVLGRNFAGDIAKPS